MRRLHANMVPILNVLSHGGRREDLVRARLIASQREESRTRRRPSVNGQVRLHYRVPDPDGLDWTEEVVAYVQRVPVQQCLMQSLDVMRDRYTADPGDGAPEHTRPDWQWSASMVLRPGAVPSCMSQVSRFTTSWQGWDLAPHMTTLCDQNGRFIGRLCGACASQLLHSGEERYRRMFEFFSRRSPTAIPMIGWLLVSPFRFLTGFCRMQSTWLG